MQYNQLITDIQADIYSNGAELITGDILQNVLVAMVGGLAAAGACYKGVITTSSAAPADLDQATIYLALTAGTYTNFMDSSNNPIVTTGPALIIYEGGPLLVFSKTDLPFATTGDLSNYLELDGGTMGGAIDMDGYAIQNVPDPVNNGDAANKGYVDSKQPWKVTISPDTDMAYIYIVLDDLNQGCILAIDSVAGAGALHGILCIDTNFDINAAVFAGYGGIDTTVDAKSGYDNGYTPTRYIAVLKFRNDQPVTITCIGGTHPLLAEAIDALSSETFTSTRAWTNLEAGGGVTPVTSWQNPPTNTDVPAEKLVYDSLGQKGVLSQTQTWSGTGSNPRTYVMSGQVTGLIPQSFIDMAVSAGATFNPNGYQTGVGYFELNGLTDISYAEMRNIYNSFAASAQVSAAGGTMFRYYGTIRGIYELFSTSAVSLTYSFFNMANLESVYIRNVAANNLSHCFRNDSKLRAIIGNGLSFIGTTAASIERAFENCYSLVDVQIKGLKVDVSFAESSALSPASVAYMINNAGTATITITLHATAYAAANADADVITALAAHTNVTLASA